MIEIADQLLFVEDASGGEIKGKNPEAAGHSAHICDHEYISTIIGGTAKVDDIFSAGENAVFTVSTDTPLSEGASIGISAAADQIVCNSIDEAAKEFFRSADDNYVLERNETTGDLSFVVMQPEDQPTE